MASSVKLPGNTPPTSTLPTKKPSGKQSCSKPVIKAYRVQRVDNPKVVVEGGRVTGYLDDEGGDFGINISFGDEEHAMGFLKNKGSSAGDYEVVAFDFDKELYDMIQARIDGGSPSKWRGNEKWGVISKCRKPVPTSDHWVTNKKDVLHLPKSPWIEALNWYAKGGSATVTPGSDFLGDEEAEEEVVLAPTVVVLHDDGNYEWPRAELHLLEEGVETKEKQAAIDEGIAFTPY